MCKATTVGLPATYVLAALPAAAGPTDGRGVAEDGFRPAAAKKHIEKIRASRWQDAVELAREVHASGLSGRDLVAVCNSAANTCGKASLLGPALSLLDALRAWREEPDVVTYGTLTNLCAKSRQWMRAWDIAHAAQDVGIAINTLVFNSALSALEETGLWRRALCMRWTIVGGLKPDIITSNACVSVCGRQGLWRQACTLLEHVLSTAIEMTVVTCAVVDRGRGVAAAQSQMLDRNEHHMRECRDECLREVTGVALGPAMLSGP